MQNDLSKLLLPSEVFEHFDLIAVEEYPQHFILRLDEKNLPPRKHNYAYTSKDSSPRSKSRTFRYVENRLPAREKNENGLKSKQLKWFATASHSPNRGLI